MPEEKIMEKIKQMAVEGINDEKKIECINILAEYIGKEKGYEAISNICEIAMDGSVEIMKKTFEIIKNAIENAKKESQEEESRRRKKESGMYVVKVQGK